MYLDIRADAVMISQIANAMKLQRKFDSTASKVTLNYTSFDSQEINLVCEYAS